MKTLHYILAIIAVITVTADCLYAQRQKKTPATAGVFFIFLK